MALGKEVLSVVTDILRNARGIDRACRLRSLAMPYKDPEKNRAAAAERQRLYRERHPDRVRESQRKYHENMPEEAKAKKRERDQRYRDENREQVRAWARDWYARNPRSKERTRKGHLGFRHGMTLEDFGAMWVAQDGRCCYCERPLPEDTKKVHIDHDHSCTCGPKNTCQSCRRGLSCDACNQIIGKTDEDWDRLERIAVNGRRLQVEARERINTKPVQGELPIDIKRAARRREESA